MMLARYPQYNFVPLFVMSKLLAFLQVASSCILWKYAQVSGMCQKCS